MFERVVMQHCQVPELTVGGVMNEGFESMRLGLKGMPAAAEDIMVARDIRLAEITGGRLHIQHISTARSVELVREGERRGGRGTGGGLPAPFHPPRGAAAPLHLALQEDPAAADLVRRRGGHRRP